MGGCSSRARRPVREVANSGVDMEDRSDEHHGGAGSPVTRSTRAPADRTWPMVFATAALLPIVVIGLRLVSQVRSPWHPLGDLANIELATRSVGSGHVLVGPYSRMGWNHPGPAMFYALAPAYRAVGGASVGLPLGAVLLNLTSGLAIIVVILRRRSTTLLLACLPLLAVLIASLGPRKLQDPWNPSLGILPLALFLVLSWTFSCGSAWSLPGMVAVGSFVVQTHVGYMLTVVTVALVASLGFAFIARRTRSSSASAPTRRMALPVLVSAGVGLLVWAPPIWQQLTEEPGNLTQLARYLADARPSWSLLEGYEMALTRAGALVTGVTGTPAMPDPVTLRGAPIWGGVATVAVLAAASVAAVRHHDADKVRLGALAWAILFTTGLTAARIEGPAEDWLLEWMIVAGFPAWLLGAWTLFDRPRRTTGADRSRSRVAVLTAALVTASVATSGVAAALTAPPLAAGRSAAVADLSHQVRAALGPRPRQAVLVTFGPSAGGGPSSVAWGTGVVLELVRTGTPVTVDPRWRYQFGDRLARPAVVHTVLTVVTDRRYRPSTGMRAVAEVRGVRVFSQRR